MFGNRTFELSRQWKSKTGSIFFSQLVVFSSIFLSYKHVENMFGFEIGRSILNDIYTGFFHHHHYHHMYEKRALSYVSFDLLLLRLFLAN